MNISYSNLERIEDSAFIPLDIIRSHCNIEHSNDDQLLNIYLDTAEDHISLIIDRPISRHKVLARVPSYDYRTVTLNYSPIHSITSVHSVTGAEKVLINSDDYTVEYFGRMKNAAIVFGDNVDLGIGSMQIEFVAGFINSGVNYSSLTHAGLLVVSACYEIRESIIPHNVNSNPAFRSLIQPFRRF